MTNHSTLTLTIMACAAGNELEVRSAPRRYNIIISRVIQYVVLRHFYYEYHYSPHKLAFQNIMRAGDQKLMINLEWP